LLIPPILGGDYRVENTVVLPITEHYGVCGSYHEQLRGVPDGTKVVIKVKKPTGLTRRGRRSAMPDTDAL